MEESEGAVELAGSLGASGSGMASAPPPGPRRPHLRGVVNQMVAPLASLLQATSESASQPRVTYTATGAW